MSSADRFGARATLDGGVDYFALSRLARLVSATRRGCR